jgi:hypothetical protein
MNHISSRLKYLSELCDTTLDIIYDPEKAFGPNYKTLLNFWIYLDIIGTAEQMRYHNTILNMDDAEWVEAKGNTNNAAAQMNGNILMQLTCYELELVVAHILIDSGKTLTFIPLLETNDSL